MPRLRNDKLYVEGDLIELDKPVPKAYEQRWLTSKILGRVRRLFLYFVDVELDWDSEKVSLNGLYEGTDI